jgi:hypothetical protein
VAFFRYDQYRRYPTASTSPFCLFDHSEKVQMTGLQRIIPGCLVLSLLICAAGPAQAQPREAEAPIGGITFDPPRPAILRHKSGNVVRGEVMAISPDLVQFRLQSGKVFQYELKEIRSIVTNDRAFRYNSAHDTYRKAVESARGLPGVSVEAVAAAAAGGGGAPQMPTPPQPPVPVMLDPPDKYKSTRIDPTAVASAPAPGLGAGPAERQAGGMPPIPANQPAANAGLANVPIYETGAFKIGFLVACFVVILLWWRNRVG